MTEELSRAEIKYQEINKQLKIIEEKMMIARENKARSGATSRRFRKIEKVTY